MARADHPSYQSDNKRKDENSSFRSRCSGVCGVYNGREDISLFGYRQKQ